MSVTTRSQKKRTGQRNTNTSSVDGTEGPVAQLLHTYKGFSVLEAYKLLTKVDAVVPKNVKLVLSGGGFVDLGNVLISEEDDPLACFTELINIEVQNLAAVSARNKRDYVIEILKGDPKRDVPFKLNLRVSEGVVNAVYWATCRGSRGSTSQACSIT